MDRRRVALLGMVAGALMVGIIGCSRPTPVPGEETVPLAPGAPGGYPQPSQPEAAPTEGAEAYPGGVRPSVATAEAVETAGAAKLQGIGYPAPADGTPGASEGGTGAAQPAATP